MIGVTDAYLREASMKDPNQPPVDLSKGPDQSSGQGPTPSAPAGQPGHPPSGAYPAPPPGQWYPPTHGYGSGQPPLSAKPSNNIGWAIAAIFLCWPFCIPAFIYSSRVDSLFAWGDLAGAQQASNDARRWGMIGVIVGVVLTGLSFLFVVVFIGFAVSHVHDLPIVSPSSFSNS